MKHGGLSSDLGRKHDNTRNPFIPIIYGVSIVQHNDIFVMTKLHFKYKVHFISKFYWQNYPAG